MDSSINGYGKRRTLLFLAFFLSGFCGLLYQTIWLRLAFADFGVITPVVSVIVSVFMLGLGIGSLAGGKFVAFLNKRFNLSPLACYAVCELLIGLGAFAVPQAFALGTAFLTTAGESNSFAYLLSSAMVMTLSILPWCICMGLTIPFVMAYLRELESDRASFSFLYFANVLGAIAGILMTAMVLVELLGFRGTLCAAAVCNFLIASVALLSLYRNKCVNGRKAEDDAKDSSARELLPEPAESGAEKSADAALLNSGNNNAALGALILFSTGFSSMGMEVVWTRAFNNIMGTEVYSFARLVAAYLLSTAIGSYFYRADLKNSSVKSNAWLLAVSAVLAFLPVVLNDSRFAFFPNVTREILEALALLSIAPICALLGYLTPKLIDDVSAGDPVIAGKAYAINIAGSIIGPLLAGYFLLPQFGSKVSLVLLALPFLFLAALFLKQVPKKAAALTCVLALALAAASCFSESYEEGGLLIPGVVKDLTVRRDHTATVISCRNGAEKLLMVNGTHMTVLTQLAKYDAHLPLIMLKSAPESALVICFGMGTTFRSLLSWDINTTAVELVPSVRDAFTYYHGDAAEVLKNPKGRIVIDDGRRYLNRSKELYDIVTIDPPPPENRAGSSLLYSTDFYRELKMHLKEGGILQQWLPGNDMVLRNAVVRSLLDSFKYVRAFPSMPWTIAGVEGRGIHFLASNQPIENLDYLSAYKKLSGKAKGDLCEWFPPERKDEILLQQLQFICAGKIDARQYLFPQYEAKITDDRPFNEYYFVRDILLKRRSTNFQ